MDEIIHVGFESPGLSFLRDLTIDELIDHIVENVEAYSEAMEAAAMLETNCLAGIYRGTGWRMWFCRRAYCGSVH